MNQWVGLAIFGYITMLLSISLHDAAQAWMAKRLGDPTAAMLGRLTVNPIKHFDVLGTGIWPLLILFGLHSPLALGWGKQIPVTTRNLKKFRDEMVIFAVGPVAQFAAAVVCLLVLVILKHASPLAAGSIGIASQLAQGNLSVPTEGLPGIFPVVLLLYFGILVNLLLCVFNLMPLPALDGGKVLRYYLPLNAQRMFDQMGIYLMFAFFFFGFRVILAVFTPLLVLFHSLLNAL